MQIIALRQSCDREEIKMINDSMEVTLAKAQTLIEALPYIQKFSGKKIVVKYGGIIEDVIVEHPLYGEIKGILKIKNLNDLNKFTGYFEKVEAKPLSALTNGIHLHTISADSEENMNLIKMELKEKGFIL